MTGNNGLPQGWVWTTIGEACKTTSGGTPSRKVSSYYGGEIPWLKSGELEDSLIHSTKEFITDTGLKNSSAKVFPKGTLLIALYGATVGKLGILGIDAATNQAICALYPPEDLDNKYLFWFLRKQREELLKARIGGAQPNISQSILREVALPLPPRPEQERIVARIEELFTQLEAGVAELQNAKAQLKRYRASVLKSAVEGELTREWREAHQGQVKPAEKLLARILSERREKWEAEGGKGKYKEPAAPETDGLPELPNGWMWVNVGQIADFRNGINFSKTQKGNKGVLTIDVLNMYSKGIYVDFDNLYRVNKDVSDSQVLKQGDVLFVRSSVKREGVGWATCFREHNEPVSFCGFIIRARLMTDEIYPEYLTYFMRTSKARNDLIGGSSQVTITNINQPSLAKIILPLPPLDEQKVIVAKIERRLSVADEIEKELDEALVRAERLRASVLKSAFEGRLV